MFAGMVQVVKASRSYAGGRGSEPGGYKELKNFILRMVAIVYAYILISVLIGIIERG